MADRKKPPEPDQQGCPMYMLSFGDMMTNLLCFFILLCAFTNERRVGFISDGLGAFRKALLAHGMPGVLKSDTLPMDLGAKRVLFRPSKAVMPRMLVDKDGHMITKLGEASGYDPETVSALVAGSFAATRQVAAMLGECEFSAIFHQGKRGCIQFSIVGDRGLGRRRPLHRS